MARPRRCLAQAASASGPAGSKVTVAPVMSTLRAASQLAPDGGVVQPGVVRGHLGGVVVEDAAHDLLRDVAVDQPGAQGVAPLVRGQVHRVAVLVADVAGGQPAQQRHPVGRTGDRVGAVDVLRRPREQAGRSCRPALGGARCGVRRSARAAARRSGTSASRFILWLK